MVFYKVKDALFTISMVQITIWEMYNFVHYQFTVNPEFTPWFADNYVVQRLITVEQIMVRQNTPQWLLVSFPFEQY